MSLLLALALQVLATPTPTSHCTGARRNEVCTETGRAELRQQLGLQPLEVETAQGVEVYRAFYLEGGGARPAIAFVRRPGRNPAVEVMAGGGRLMRADVPLDVWRQVQAAGQIADLAVVPRSGSEGGCMDGGAVFAEIGVPATDSRSPAINRQRAASSCEDSGTLFFSRLLVQQAERLLPGCAAISRDFLSEGVTRLHFCFRLTGDQVAAAEVMGLAHSDVSVGEDDSVARKRAEWARATGEGLLYLLVEYSLNTCFALVVLHVISGAKHAHGCTRLLDIADIGPGHRTRPRSFGATGAGRRP